MGFAASILPWKLISQQPGMTLKTFVGISAIRGHRFLFRTGNGTLMLRTAANILMAAITVRSMKTARPSAEGSIPDIVNTMIKMQ
jgi:hypothetical protein